MLPTRSFYLLLDLARWRASAIQEPLRAFCRCSLSQTGSCSRKRPCARRRRSRVVRGRSTEPSDGDGGPSSPDSAKRRHRIRSSHPCEIATNEIVDGEALTPPSGWAWFTVVKNIVPGVRTRLYTPFYADAPTDVDEATARHIYRQLETPASRELEQAIHQAQSKGGTR